MFEALPPTMPAAMTCEGDDVALGDAPNDLDADGEAGGVPDGVAVLDVPTDGVHEGVALSDAVVDGGGVLDTDAELVSDTEPVAVSDTLAVRDGVSDGEGVELGLGDADGYSANMNLSVLAAESKNATPGYAFTLAVATNVGGSVLDNVNGEDHVLPASARAAYTIQL